MKFTPGKTWNSLWLFVFLAILNFSQPAEGLEPSRTPFPPAGNPVIPKLNDPVKGFTHLPELLNSDMRVVSGFVYETNPATPTPTPTRTPTPICVLPPIISAVVLEPRVPRAGQILIARPVGYYDPCNRGDENARFFYTWYVEERNVGINTDYLPAKYFTIGSRIRAEVIPFNGVRLGLSKSSDRATAEKGPDLDIRFVPPLVNLNPGKSGETLVEILEAAPEAASITLTATSDNPNLQLDFRPDSILTNRNAPRGISVLSLTASALIQPGTALVHIRTAASGRVQDGTLAVSVLSSQERQIVLNADTNKTELGQGTFLRGLIQPVSFGDSLLVMTQGPASNYQIVPPSTNGGFQLFWSPEKAGNYQIHAFLIQDTSTGMPSPTPTPTASPTPVSTWQSEEVHWQVNYDNNWNLSGTVTKPGATRIRLHFSSISVESGYDHLRTDAGDDWTGNYTDVYSTEKAGNSISLTLTSDASFTGHFIIDRVEYQGTSTGPSATSGMLFETFTYYGELTADDDLSVSYPSRYADVWRFIVDSTRTIEIRMLSYPFELDNLLILYRGSEPSFAGKMLENDDDPEAHIQWQDLEPGLYCVEATSFESEGKGSYSIESSVPLTLAPRRSFAVSGIVNGAIISGVTIQFSKISGGGRLPPVVQTGSGGSWNQTGFDGGSAYRAEPSRDGFVFYPPYSDFRGPRTDVEFHSYEEFASKLVPVHVARSSQTSLVLSASYQSPLRQGSPVKVRGQLNTLSIASGSEAITLTVGMEGGIPISENVFLNRDRSMEYDYIVPADSGILEAQAEWVGDENNLGITSSRLAIPIGGLLKDGLLVGGKPGASVRDSAIRNLTNEASMTCAYTGYDASRLTKVAAEDPAPKARILDVLSKISGGAAPGQAILFIYLVGNGTRQGLELGDGSILTPEDLASALQGKSLTVFLCIESDYSGIFTRFADAAPADQRRLVVTSAGDDEITAMTTGGAISFSRYFLQKLREETVGNCYNYARNELSKLYGLAFPSDPRIQAVNMDAFSFKLGEPVNDYGVNDYTPPLLGDTHVILSGDFQAQLLTRIVENDQIDSVTALVSFPGSGRWREIHMEPAGNGGIYLSSPFTLDIFGSYVFTAFARDRASNHSSIQFYSQPVNGYEKGDLTRNRTLDAMDLFLWSPSWYRSIGSPGYNGLADFDDDGLINNTDAIKMWDRFRSR